MKHTNFLLTLFGATILTMSCSTEELKSDQQEPVIAAENELAKVAPAKYPGWPLYWVDNFSRGPLDENNWRIGYPWGSRTHNHNGYAIESNVQFSNYAVNLIAGGGKQGDRYHTGVISCKEQIDFSDPNVEYIVEARLKLGNRNGIWPAFWLNSVGPWPNINEIDIMEQKGWGDQKKYENVFHFAVESGGRPSQHRTSTGPNNLDTNWHRYGVAIKKNEVKIMFDGRTVNRITNVNRVRKLRSKTFNIILNSAIGGAWGGNGYQAWIDDFSKTSTYSIDYVAIYKRFR